MGRYYILVENSLGDLRVHVETDSLDLARVCAEALSLRYHRESWLIYSRAGDLIDRYALGEVVHMSNG